MMAGIFDRVKKLVTLDDYEEEYVEEESTARADEIITVTKSERANAPAAHVKKAVGAENYGYGVPTSYSTATGTFGTRSQRSSYTMEKDNDRENLIPMKDRSISAITRQYKIVVNRPTCFEESAKIVDSLRAKRPVIVNLEGLDVEVQRKIYDFLSGAVYALGCRVEKLSSLIFMYTPDNVEVASDNEGDGINFAANSDMSWKR
ncbi:MAG: cell division protein SepF [Clostridiales Family XIII bacterium]|jgi:cell division inhibitor SepF|nr:cell division protein SepF [Clostridiales Family XIII bacterium]